MTDRKANSAELAALVSMIGADDPEVAGLMTALLGDAAPDTRQQLEDSVADELNAMMMDPEHRDLFSSKSFEICSTLVKELSEGNDTAGHVSGITLGKAACILKVAANAIFMSIVDAAQRDGIDA